MAEPIEASKHVSTDSSGCNNLNLSFPTLPVDASLSEIVLRGDRDNMRPAPPSRTPSEAASALEGSTYEFISTPDLSGSGILSDDDTRTESLASDYDNVTDDLSYGEVDGESDEEEDVVMEEVDNSAVLGGPRGTHNAEEEPVVHVTPTIDESGYTTRTARPEDSVTYLDFNVDTSEPQPDESVERLVHVVQDGSVPNCKPELQVYDAKYVGVEMVMSVARNFTKLPDSLRVLIVGPNMHFGREIVEHIEYALGPTDLSQGERPHVSISHCNNAYFNDDRLTIMLDLDSPAPSTIALRGGRVSRGQANYSPWDLAIFMHSSLANVSLLDVDQVENTFETARLGLTTCKIPIIDLSMHRPLYCAVPHSFYCNKDSLCLRVTTRKDQASTQITRELLPVEVDQFLLIHPQTLGAHLSVLLSKGVDRQHPRSAGKPLVDMSRITRDLKISFESTSRYVSQALDNLNMRDVITALAFTMAAILMCTQIFGDSTVKKDDLSIPVPTVSAPSTTPSVEMWRGIMSKISGPPVAVPSESGSLSISDKQVYREAKRNAREEKRQAKQKQREAQRKQQAEEQKKWEEMRRAAEADRLERQDMQLRLRKQGEAMMSQALHEYSLEAINSQTLVLTAPAHLVPHLKSTPALTVIKNGKPLDIRVKHLSRGVWAIDIPQTAGQGDAILSFKAEYVLPHFGPYVVDYQFPFTQDKSSFAKVKDLVAQEFVLVHNNALELSNRMTTGLQRYFGDIQQQTLKRVNETKKALIELSSGEVVLWQSKKQRVKTSKRQSAHIASELQASMRAAHVAASQRVQEALETIRSLAEWQQNTEWPVRAADWKPHVAARRGLGNAQGLLKKLANGQPASTKQHRAAAGQCGQKCKRKCQAGKH